MNQHLVDNKNKAEELKLNSSNILVGLVKQYGYKPDEIDLEVLDMYHPYYFTGLEVKQNHFGIAILTFEKAMEYAEIGKGQRRVNKTYRAVEYYVDDNDIQPNGNSYIFVGVSSDDVAEKVIYHFSVERGYNNIVKVSKSLVRLNDDTYFIIEEDNNG